MLLFPERARAIESISSIKMIEGSKDRAFQTILTEQLQPQLNEL
jgi:hypothetical protein